MLARVPARLRRFSRLEYERMADAGLFRDERVELLYGHIVEMSAHGRRHAFAIQRLTRAFRALGERADLRVQLPFAAADDSEPEPDLAVVAFDDGGRSHPKTAFLIIEVADSSLADDLEKRQVYAAARVAEYWIVNLVDDVVERYTEPRERDYARVDHYHRGDVLAVPGFEGLTLEIDALIPSR